MADIDLPDTSLTLLEAIAHNETRNAQYPLFRYQDADGHIQSITWGQAGKAFDIAARIVIEGVGADDKPETDMGHPKVVGIVANLDSITFYSLVVGIMRAGFTPFPISIRNPPEAIAHLMAATGCTILLSTDDAAVSQLAATSVKMLEEIDSTNRSARIIPAPYFDQLYGSEVLETLSSASKVPPQRKDVDKGAIPCVISHSSGTTSLPKPITLTNRMINQHGSRNRHEPEGDFRCCTLSAHAIPMYHMMGFTLIPWSTMLGFTLSVIRPRKPPIMPSPDLVLRGAVATSSSILYCAPTFLEAWATEASNVDALKMFNKILYGGGPVQDDIAVSLVKQGAKLLPILGLSETGVITTFYPKHIQKEGPAWYETDSRIDVVFIPEDEEKLKGVYRLAIKENAVRKPASFDIVIDGVPAFDTKDLVMYHPTNPKLWKIVGRADDQITHSTGEKTNPVPIEAMLEKSPYISAALMFGRARLQPGVIITPYKDYVFDISDNPSRRSDDYLNLIWDTITAANHQSPQHSRIFKEENPKKPFEYTAKGTIRRHVTLNKYQKEIEQLYEVTENSSATEYPRSLEPAAITSVIRSAVQKILEREVEDDDDIFRVGADSLCALSIRVDITRWLEGMVGRSAIDTLPRDLLYIYPTISSLSTFISGPFLSAVAQLRFDASQTSTAVNSLEDDVKWQAALQSKETVVELVPSQGEPPLIIIHAGGGNIDPFQPFMKCTSAIWAIQMGDEVPIDSTETIVAYYYGKVKEKQPRGPYRFASYSGSSVYLIALVSLFERKGDEVEQFVMLDHCPSLFFPDFRPDDVHVDDPEWMKQYLHDTIHTIANLLIPAITVRPRLLSNTVLVKRNEGLMATLNGAEAPAPHIAHFVRMVTVMQDTSVRYLMSEEFMAVDDKGNAAWSFELFRKFMARIKAPLTIYVASEGANLAIPREMKQAKKDLGASMFLADVRIVPIPGDHLSFLEEADLHRSVEGKYYRGQD